MDEPSNRDKRADLPRGHAKLGILSPAFASPDEVARYLHGRVGLNLQVEFGSVIMRRLSDGLYVASEPVPDRPTVFNFNLLLDNDPAKNTYLDPEGYHLVASWHTHPNTTAWVTRLNPKWTAHQVTAYQGFFSSEDIIFNHQNRPKFRDAYLSGPDGTLIKYQYDETPAALGFAHWITTRGDFKSPHAFDGTLEGLYKKVASVGQLTFLISSPYWGGSLGRVPADWEPYKPWPRFADTLAALVHAWSVIQRKPSVRQRVLILQADTEDEFAVTEPERIEGLADTLPTLPVGYHLHGIYTHARPLPGHYPDLEAWLYKNFISPQDLALHIAQFRQYSRGPQSTLGASLYIRMRDEAILRYRFSGSVLESQLFALAEDGTVSDNGTQAALHKGSLLTRDFVRQVAAAGELSVEKTSALWDRSGVVDEHWRPYADYALPALSGDFLTADDAARYAHAQIGGRREQVLGGMILQRQDGRFVVTEPVPTGLRPFAFNRLYPLDRQQVPIILSPGLRLHGRYGSRTALLSSDPGPGARTTWTRQSAEVSGQMFQPTDVADLQVAGGVGYLSGTEDSLITLAPSVTTDAWRQQWQPGATGGDSPIAKKLADGTHTAADVVRTLAECGTLRVVMGNPMWGPTGFIEVDWEPWGRNQQFERPETVSHGAIFASADEAARDLYQRNPHEFVPQYVNRYFGFILKRDGRDEYVASELFPVTDKSPLFSLTHAYGTRLPDGFECHGLFYSRPYADRGVTVWLQRYFIDLDDLSEAITLARANAWSPPLGALIYIAPPEGALLRYQSPSPEAILESRSTQDSSDTLLAKLNVGSLEASQVVGRVASSGNLQVLQTSRCWDRAGRVSGAWQPYQFVSRRHLYPAFLTMDDAARDLRRRMPRTLGEGYGGVILMRDDGCFVATEPVRVPDEVFDVNWLFPDEVVSLGLFPSRCMVVASYHSRPARHWPFLLSPTEAAVYSNMFSTRLLAQALSLAQSHYYQYLLAPDGALLRLQSRPGLKYPLITPTDLIPHPQNPYDWLTGTLEGLIRKGDVTPSAYVNRVARTFNFQVVVGSALWGEPGPVVAWSAYPPPSQPEGRYVRARQDPPCSAVHIRMDDAARYAHRLAGVRSQLQFGYLMQQTGNGYFVATLPITADGSGLAERRVFTEAGYPHRYQVCGMYVCAPLTDYFHPKAPAQAGDDIFQGLVAPTTLNEAFYQVHGTTTRRALPLYLSCADGALLKLVLHDGQRFSSLDDQRLQQRKLSPTDYIRRLATAGDLRIVVPSTHWPGEGAVDAQWQPGRSQGVLAAGDNPYGLGPVYIHRDDAAYFSYVQLGRYGGVQAVSALLERLTGRECHVPVLAVRDDGFPSSIAESIFSAQWPQGYRISAAHLVFHAGEDQPHIGVEQSYAQNFVSWRELGFYLHQLKRRSFAISGFYLTTRDNALLSYTPTFSQEEYNLLETAGKWTAAGGYTPFAPTPSYVLSQLARIGTLRVIRGGAFWGETSRVLADLKQPAIPTHRRGREEL